MKKTVIIIAIFIVFKATAQSPVINFEDRQGARITGAYYKDGANQLNPFVGTWLFTNGNTSLKIVLVKKIMDGDAVSYYEDILIGEYQYIENGVEKFNSLSDLYAVLPNAYHHKIKGNHFHTFRSPFNELTAGEKILDLYFKDNCGGSLYVRKKMVGSQQAIQIYRELPSITTIGGTVPNGTVPIIKPIEEFTLLKQP